MKKFKDIIEEITVFTVKNEDMPTTSAGSGGVAGIGVPMPGEPASSAEPGIDPKKRKKKIPLIDGRTKAYRKHRQKLEAQRQRREAKKDMERQSE